MKFSKLLGNEYCEFINIICEIYKNNKMFVL